MTNQTNKIHKQGCLANVHCLVYHPDGVCPGPYGKCNCDELPETPPIQISNADITGHHAPKDSATQGEVTETSVARYEAWCKKIGRTLSEDSWISLLRYQSWLEKEAGETIGKSNGCYHCGGKPFVSVSTKKGRRKICNSCGRDWQKITKSTPALPTEKPPKEEQRCEECLAHYTGNHVCDPVMKGLKSLYDRGSSKSYNYSHISHSHCWDQQPSACGINLENHEQCCLCDLKYAWSDKYAKPQSKDCCARTESRVRGEMREMVRKMDVGELPDENSPEIYGDKRVKAYKYGYRSALEDVFRKIK